LIYLSSIRALGAETAGKPFNGAEIPAPPDAYGRAKAAAEQALDEVAAKTGLQVIVLRPPLVYGPGVKANFLALMRAIARGWPLPLAGIDNRRSLLYSGNLADAIARCIEAPTIAAGKFVLADGAPVSTSALCRAIGESLERPARLFSAPAVALELLPGLKALTRSLEVDDAAFRHAFAWRPPVIFADAIRRTAQWYRLECRP
jgi:nucleoside-diphosphate-sugar epimerase